MNSILLKYNRSLKKVSIRKFYSAVDLGHLIAHTFEIKQKVVGVTDNMGKFYDLEYISQNLPNFKHQTLTLVTYKQVTEDNMSFASSNQQTITPQKIQKSQKQQSEFAYQETQKTINLQSNDILGYVQDVTMFQKLFLESAKFTILIKTPNIRRVPKMNLPYFITSGTQIIIVIYYGQKKVCQLYNENWDNIDQKIEDIMKKQLKQVNKRNNKNRYPNQIVKQQLRDYSFEPLSKQVVMNNLKILLDNEDISEVQYLKLKCEFFEYPEQFYEKYRFNQQSNIESFRAEILKSKQEKTRYQVMLNNFGGYSKQRIRQQRNNKKYQIPIIVRKNNNVIQKISTNYHISSEQQHSMHLIAQLELKGLISESQASFIKSQILYENEETFAYFMDYFNNQIDQIQLSKKLRQLKKYHKKSQSQSMNQRESLMKLILKYSSPFNLEILKKLVLQNNEHIVNAYDQYGINMNEELFGQNLQKIANFYKAKQELEEIPILREQQSRRVDKHRGDRRNRQINF